MRRSGRRFCLSELCSSVSHPKTYVESTGEWAEHKVNIFRTGLLNYLNARSRGLTFRHRASCI